MKTTRLGTFSNTWVTLSVLLLPVTMAICGRGGAAGNVEATVAAGIAATQQAQINLQATVDAAVLATQAAGQPPSVPLPASTSVAVANIPASASDLEAVRNVILNEVNAAVSQDLAQLQTLFAPNAMVIDRAGTPNDPSDDTVWQGWANIERRYQAFFSSGVTSLTLVDLAIQLNGNQAIATHQGVVQNGVLYADQGSYILENMDGKWLITQLEYGNAGQSLDQPPAAPAPANGSTDLTTHDDGLYALAVGSQHRYEEPWGWDRGDPCEAWATNNFDDTKPNYRGFNVELLLTNNSDSKVPDNWPISFTTANGKSVKPCFYGYHGSGPEPGVTRSVTFFTVVEQGDYVAKITFSLNDQTLILCLDGKGGWQQCNG
ncbi:MAG: nuclear transport factor 2 family protein [Anaerolineaceae bacterium]|nr:nuclear transport factor 2 family protein [Anaerolineaceae bacterium]MCB9098358.1 nuclear transport factor 2 family protein [Anaerolineales bacterium]